MSAGVHQLGQFLSKFGQRARLRRLACILSTSWLRLSSRWEICVTASRIGSRCCLRIVILSNRRIALGVGPISRRDADRRQRAGWPFSMARAKSFGFLPASPAAHASAGFKYSRMRRLSLAARSWQLDDMIESRRSFGTTGMQQRHDRLQSMACRQDSAIEPLSAFSTRLVRAISSWRVNKGIRPISIR